MRWNGAWPAVTTPFADGEVRPEALAANLERYERLDLGGYLVLGSTGEAVLLEEGERRRLLEAARGAIPDGKPLMVGLPAESTRLAVAQARAASAAGADAVLVGCPHYFGAQMTDAALHAHLAAVAEASALPCFLYNVPKFTGIELSTALIASLAEQENVVGIKESSGDASYLREVIAATEGRLTVLCGAAPILSEAMEAGASGGILAAACAFPEPFVDIAGGARLGPTERRLFDEACARIAGQLGVAGIKCAMELRGLIGGEVRSPLQAVSPDERDEIALAIDRLVAHGVLPALEL